MTLVIPKNPQTLDDLRQAMAKQTQKATQPKPLEASADPTEEIRCLKNQHSKVLAIQWTNQTITPAIAILQATAIPSLPLPKNYHDNRYIIRALQENTDPQHHHISIKTIGSVLFVEVSDFIFIRSYCTASNQICWHCNNQRTNGPIYAHLRSGISDLS